MAVIAGIVTDRFGPRWVTAFCGLCGGIGYILMSRVSNIWELYIYLGLLIGTGASLNVPLMSTVIRWFGDKKSLVTGIIMAGSGVGGVIMPLISTWLITTYTWRTTFIILGIINIIVTMIAIIFLKRDPSRLQPPQQAARLSTPAVFEEESRKLTFKEVMVNRSFWLIFFSFLFFGLAANVVNIHIVPMATDYNISVEAAAGILAFINFTSIFGRIVIGSLGDKIGNRRLYIITLALMAASFVWLVLTRDLWMFYAFSIVYGIVLGVGLVQQSPLIAVIFGTGSHGLIMGLAGFGLTIGMALGGFLAGVMYDHYGNYLLALILCAVVCLLGMVVTMILKPVKY